MDEYTAPDFRHCALITIDTQCDTLDGEPFEIPGTSAILPQVSTLLNAFRSGGRSIVHVVRLYKSDGSNADPCRRRIIEQGAQLLVPGSRGSCLAPGLLGENVVQLDTAALLAGQVQNITSREAVIYKPRWGAFYDTPLHDHLRRQGVSTLVFTGCNFPNCPRTSIYEASERDYRLVLIEDAISGLYDRGKTEMRNIGVAVMTSRECDEALAAA
jgi:nicotinamidase-related amidase